MRWASRWDFSRISWCLKCDFSNVKKGTKEERKKKKININLLFISQSRNLNFFSSKISRCALHNHKSDTIHSGLREKKRLTISIDLREES